MKNNEKVEMLNALRRDMARSQKKGQHFILAAVVIWALVLAIHACPLSMMLKNILTICCSAPIFMIAVGFSKLIKVDFFDKSNPLYKPGILFAMNQMLYIPISIWAFYACPEKMLMIYAIVTGAHLLPYGWLYVSSAYSLFSVLIAAAALVVGWSFPSWVLAAAMLLLFIIFCAVLFAEVRKAEKQFAAC